ncbi:MAG: thiol reductant ABC exporter subunit CydC [bacterium]
MPAAAGADTGVRRLWAAMRPERGRLAAAAFLGFIAAASAVALLGASGWLISRAAEMPPVLALSVAAVMVRAFALSRSFFRYVERIVGHDAAFRGLTGLRVAVYERLEVLAPVGLARFSRGDLLARLVADVDAAMDLPLRVVLPWAQAALVSVGTVAFMAWLVPGSGVVVGLALLAGLVVVPWIVARIAARAEARIAPLRGRLSGAVVGDLDGCADLLAFGAVDAAVAHVGVLDRELTVAARRESAGLGLGVGISVLVQGAAVIGSLVLAIPAVTSGRLAPVWLAVAALVPLAAYDVISSLPNSALAYQRVKAAARRLDDVLDAPPPVEEPARPHPLPATPAALECHDVVARWDPQAPPTLRGISMTLQPGERIAVVGPSGSGKSTLAAVLLAFLAYDDGTVELGGAPLRELAGDDVRRAVTLLTQSAHVFDTTVRDNLRLGRSDATDDDLLEVLQRVRLGGWLADLPNGLDAELGPRGSTLSGGERQRLALARLLLSDRPIVVLDEPTEHLDPQTADALTADLLQATRGRSTVYITHRLSGLETVDRIYVLEGGSVLAQGTHGELLVEGGWYAERWAEEQGRVS